MKAFTIRNNVAALFIFGLLLLAACQPIQPATHFPMADSTLLSWTRTGGVAGFCDQVQIDTTGAVTVANCRNEPATLVGTVQLDEPTLAQVEVWVSTLAAFDQSDTDAPDAADAMTIQMALQGTGSQNVTAEDKAQITQLMQELVSQAVKR